MFQAAQILIWVAVNRKWQQEHSGQISTLCNMQENSEEITG